MKELLQILVAFDALCAEGKPSALATVISVEGSAYRRPGARMLVAEDGRTWGGVSGGCLERDVARRARGVVATGRAVKFRYDTTDDETTTTSAATGCRGAITLYIEPISSKRSGPLSWIRQVAQGNSGMVLAGILQTSACVEPDENLWLLMSADGILQGQFRDPLLSTALRTTMPRFFFEKSGGVMQYEQHGGVIEVFIERVIPRQRLIIFGSGSDVTPVVDLANWLGWHTTVVGSRPSTGLRERCPKADQIFVNSADEPTLGVPITKTDAVVIMTHNYVRDLRILRSFRCQPRYLGILGPRSRTRELLSELEISFEFSREIHGPVGLDIGAETPDEIALAIIAEVQAVICSAPARFLSDRGGPIHGVHDNVAFSVDTFEGLACLASQG